MNMKGMSIGILIGIIAGVKYNDIVWGAAFGIIGGAAISILFSDKSDENN